MATQCEKPDWVVEKSLDFPIVDFEALSKRIVDIGQVENPSRWTMFFGHVIGRCKICNAPGFTYPKGKREIRDEVNDRSFTINNLKGHTGFIAVNSIDDAPGGSNNVQHLAPDISAICDTAIKALREEYFGPNHLSQGLWQCNVNLYTKQDDLDWHRDDRTKFSRSANTLVPSTDTFYPISATYILHELDETKHHKIEHAGLSVVMPAQVESATPASPGLCRFVNGTVVKTTRGGIAISDNDNADKGIFLEESFNDAANSNLLIILKGGAYTHGVHSFNPRWKLTEGPALRRISFNFRLVKECCWGALQRERCAGFPTEHAPALADKLDGT